MSQVSQPDKDLLNLFVNSVDIVATFNEVIEGVSEQSKDYVVLYYNAARIIKSVKARYSLNKVCEPEDVRVSFPFELMGWSGRCSTEDYVNKLRENNVHLIGFKKQSLSMCTVIASRTIRVTVHISEPPNVILPETIALTMAEKLYLIRNIRIRRKVTRIARMYTLLNR